MPASLDEADLAWRNLDGEVIFLDVAKDRYFRLPEKQNVSFIAGISSGSRAGWHLPDGLSLPPEWQEPTGVWLPSGSGTFSLPDVAHALWMQRRIERRIAVDGFASTIRTTRELLGKSATRRHGDPDRVVARLVRAFDHARLLRTAANRCLPRSIALALMLAARGIRGTVVIGVRYPPFGAHCWVQSGSFVLGDTHEEVQRFTPLLVL